MGTGAQRSLPAHVIGTDPGHSVLQRPDAECGQRWDHMSVLLGRKLESTAGIQPAAEGSEGSATLGSSSLGGDTKREPSGNR